MPVLPINAGSISLVASAGADWFNDHEHSVLPPAGTADLSGNITLSAGSLLNLEGGGFVSANGRLKIGSTGAPQGSGGSLTLETYAGTTQPFDMVATIPTRGKLILDGTIDALGMSGGGSLTLQQVAFQIGGNQATMPVLRGLF